MAKAAKHRTEGFFASVSFRGSLMRKLVSVLAKISQGDRILILFPGGRVFKKQGGMKAGRKLASRASA
jgi:hypothetical protein